MTDDPSPVAARPSFTPGYGVPTSDEGMLPWSWAEERLAAARNYWVATTRADGAPHSMTVWGLWLERAVVFSTSTSSRKARNLRRDPRAVVHLESGDELVVLEGEVEEITIDEDLARVYEEKYDYRPDLSSPEGWYRLRPRVAYAWTEAGFPGNVTRFTFG